MISASSLSRRARRNSTFASSSDESAVPSRGTQRGAARLGSPSRPRVSSLRAPPSMENARARRPDPRATCRGRPPRCSYRRRRRRAWLAVASRYRFAAAHIPPPPTASEPVRAVLSIDEIVRPQDRHSRRVPLKLAYPLLEVVRQRFQPFGDGPVPEAAGKLAIALRNLSKIG